MARDDVTVSPLPDEIPPRPESPDIPDKLPAIQNNLPTIHKVCALHIYASLCFKASFEHCGFKRLKIKVYDKILAYFGYHYSVYANRTKPFER